MYVAGSIPARNEYLYNLQGVVSGLGISVFVEFFFVFLNVPAIHEKFLVSARIKNKVYTYKLFYNQSLPLFRIMKQ